MESKKEDQSVTHTEHDKLEKHETPAHGLVGTAHLFQGIFNQAL